MPGGEIVWNGSEFAVAAVQLLPPSWPAGQVVFKRLTATGVLVDTVVIQPLSSAIDPDPDPHLVWTGAGYGVSWYDHAAGVIRFVRLAPTGAPLSAPITVTPARRISTSIASGMRATAVPPS